MYHLFRLTEFRVTYISWVPNFVVFVTKVYFQKNSGRRNILKKLLNFKIYGRYPFFQIYVENGGASMSLVSIGFAKI